VEYQAASDLSFQGNGFNEHLMMIEILEGRYDAAEVLAGGLAPGPARDQGMATVSFAMGRDSAAESFMARLRAEGTADSAIRLAEIHAGRGGADQSFYWLKQATERILDLEPDKIGHETIRRLRHSRFLVALHDDPRWKLCLDYLEGSLTDRPELRLSLNSR
jgi:hypothetical protein